MGVLDGKAVIVTGSGRGLGRAYVKLAAAEGAEVVVNDCDGDVAQAVGAEIVAAGGRAVVSEHDVSDPAAANALIDLCMASYGRIDGLVNNAGRLDWHPAWEITEEKIADVVGTNVLGVLYTGVAAMRAMRPQHSGVIVNIISGAHLGYPDMAVYSASKGAVASVTYTWALDLAADGVRVNGFSPLGRTRMGPMGISGIDTGELSGGPEPELVAPAVVYLLSDAAAGLSGQILRFEGDRLGVLVHPHFVDVAEREKWDVGAIAEAVDDGLRDKIGTVGLAPVDLRYVTGSPEAVGGS
ncbi:MAG: SDR family oxidoreductase [Acidobacteria bacterium]|nr:SDR family oxidoreductase [Acidobacteriota bacterium]